MVRVAESVACVCEKCFFGEWKNEEKCEVAEIFCVLP